MTNVANMPTVSVAGQTINTGPRARAFASYMRIHALEATGGYTYAQMGRFQAKPDAPKAQLAVGGGTDNPQFALIDTATKQPVANGARNLWVTETALSTALRNFPIRPVAWLLWPVIFPWGRRAQAPGDRLGHKVAVRAQMLAQAWLDVLRNSDPRET